MRNLNDIPVLQYDVGVSNSEQLDDTAGIACAAAGVVIGVIAGVWSSTSKPH
jgi:hypothetical protein